MGLFGFILFGILCFLNLDICFLLQDQDIFSHNFIKCIFDPFLSCFSGSPIMHKLEPLLSQLIGVSAWMLTLLVTLTINTSQKLLKTLFKKYWPMPNFFPAYSLSYFILPFLWKTVLSLKSGFMPLHLWIHYIKEILFNICLYN